MEKYMTVKEVMAYLEVARPTVYKYVSQGKLQIFHKGVGRTAYFDREEVEKLAVVRPANEQEATYTPDPDELAELLERIASAENMPSIPHSEVRAELARLKAARRGANRAIA